MPMPSFMPTHTMTSMPMPMTQAPMPPMAIATMAPVQMSGMPMSGMSQMSGMTAQMSGMTVSMPLSGMSAGATMPPLVPIPHPPRIYEKWDNRETFSSDSTASSATTIIHDYSPNPQDEFLQRVYVGYGGAGVYSGAYGGQSGNGAGTRRKGRQNRSLHSTGSFDAHTDLDDVTILSTESAVRTTL
ncbi:hypothetical protein B484DRAFT_183066 [Ochromonadaceae sp. CCMP2298]|nr:hypothetical protein B484DRAFT_183066 [Ochromonadaceae sp. CCMP2298]